MEMILEMNLDNTIDIIVFLQKGSMLYLTFLNDLGEDFELDVIGVDCDFSEDSLENVLNSYNLESFEELNDNTIAVLLDNGNVLYQNY